MLITAHGVLPPSPLDIDFPSRSARVPLWRVLRYFGSLLFLPPPPPFPSSTMPRWQTNNLFLVFDSKECSCSTHIFQCKFLHQKSRTLWVWVEVSCIAFSTKLFLSFLQPFFLHLSSCLFVINLIFFLSLSYLCICLFIVSCIF